MEAPRNTKTLIHGAVLAAIEDAGTTLNAVATATRLPQSTLYRQLVQNVGAIDVEKLGLIAEHLGMSVEQLISTHRHAA